MKEIEVFIAGSKELTALRDSARAALVEIGNRRRKDNVVLRSYTFEDFSKAVTKGGQQAEYNKYIREKADCVIFIFDEGFGNRTMEELDVAYASFVKRRKPAIFIFCNEKRLSGSPGYEKLCSWCSDRNQYFISYEDGHFKDKLTIELTNFISFEMDRPYFDLDVAGEALENAGNRIKGVAARYAECAKNVVEESRRSCSAVSGVVVEKRCDAEKAVKDAVRRVGRELMGGLDTARETLSRKRRDVEEGVRQVGESKDVLRKTLLDIGKGRR